MREKNTYHVIVDNVGNVHTGHNRKKAMAVFREYRDISFSGVGRAGYENIVLVDQYETIVDHDISMLNRIYTDDGKTFGVMTGGTRHCRLDGCTGRQYRVVWPGGKITFVCGKGLVERNGRTYIG